MICKSCFSMMFDMINIEPIYTDPFYTQIRWSRIRPLYTKIIYYIYRIISKITPIDSYLLQKSTEMYVINNNDLIEYATKDELRWYYMYKFMEKHKSPEDISTILELLEDNSVADPVICKRWIGYWIYKLWNILATVHVEHLTKNPAYAGPPIGMKVENFDPNLKVYISSTGVPFNIIKYVEEDPLYI